MWTNTKIHMRVEWMERFKFWYYSYRYIRMGTCFLLSVFIH